MRVYPKREKEISKDKKKRFNVFLRSLNNISVLKINGNLKIKDLKSRIEKMTDINIEKQVLYFW